MTGIGFRGAALQASGGGVHRVFVYGSLREGFHNHDVMGKTRQLIGHSRVPGYVLVNLGVYPGAVKVKNDGWMVYGEVYEVTDEIFKKLDGLEGYPGFYNRTVVDVTTLGKAWMYFLPDTYLREKVAKFIPSGRWEGPNTQCFIWEGFRAQTPYDVQRPLLAAPLPVVGEPKGVIVPEAPKPSPKELGPIVGPGCELA